MVWSTLHVRIFLIISRYSLNVFLPLNLLLAFIVQESHNLATILHAKLCSKGFCPMGYPLLVLLIRLNFHIRQSYV